MSDTITKEQLEIQMLRQQMAQQAPGAISVQGINKYWPQIVGAVALGWFLVGQGKEQQALVGRVQVIEKSVETIGQVKADQAKTTTEVRELQTAVNAITVGQKEIASDLRAMSGQVNQIANEIRAIKGPRP